MWEAGILGLGLLQWLACGIGDSADLLSKTKSDAMSMVTSNGGLRCLAGLA